MECQSAATPPICLTIAGFDPSSGAGVTADLKTFAAHGVFGVSAITALTVQSTARVRGVEPVRPGLLRATLECLAADMPMAAVKIGMLATAPLANEVDGFLRARIDMRPRVVLDPVLRSSSGAALLDGDGVALLREHLLGAVGWVTPNLAELGWLTGREVRTPEEAEDAAQALAMHAAGLGNAELGIVVTGGHLDEPRDYVLLSGKGEWLAGERIETRATHGTGCAYSIALAAGLALGREPRVAARAAKAFVRSAMLAAYPVGHGRGPLHHLFGRIEIVRE